MQSPNRRIVQPGAISDISPACSAELVSHVSPAKSWGSKKKRTTAQGSGAPSDPEGGWPVTTLPANNSDNYSPTSSPDDSLIKPAVPFDADSDRKLAPAQANLAAVKAARRDNNDTRQDSYSPPPPHPHPQHRPRQEASENEVRLGVPVGAPTQPNARAPAPMAAEPEPQAFHLPTLASMDSLSSLPPSSSAFHPAPGRTRPPSDAPPLLVGLQVSFGNADRRRLGSCVRQTAVQARRKTM
eukprot:1879022-Rhodomonas_salina.2